MSLNLFIVTFIKIKESIYKVYKGKGISNICIYIYTYILYILEESFSKTELK